VVAEYENRRLTATLDRFLYDQPTQKRVMFLRRYFYSQSIAEIALALKVSESTVKVTLYRMREALRKELEEQDLL
jgi:RNA polymerase sigma-70 factor (ECF subfamily)